VVRPVTRGAVLALVALATPAVAAAQAPDERAAARAFADAGIRLAAFFDGSEAQFDATVTTRPPRCVRRLLRQIPDDRARQAHILAGMPPEGRVARLVEQPLLEFSRRLHGVQTADPALRSGRTAWRRLRRAFLKMAPFADLNVCVELRRYAASGFRRTPAMRRASRALDAYARAITGDFGPRLDRAIERLQELGVPRAEARAFDGETDDDRYAPAPSSPPTAPRAAS
jgi:hypothetical protein